MQRLILPDPCVVLLSLRAPVAVSPVPCPPVVRCTRLGALALGAPGPAPNAVQDTEALYVEAVVGRVLEVQYGRGTEVFGWHVLEVDKGRHNIPMPAPGPWTLQVRLVARGVAGPVGTYSLAVTGESCGFGVSG